MPRGCAIDSGHVFAECALGAELQSARWVRSWLQSARWVRRVRAVRPPPAPLYGDDCAPPPPGMKRDDYWIGVYVALSRARRLDTLLLLGEPTPQERAALEEGPPRVLLDEMERLATLATETQQRIEVIRACWAGAAEPGELEQGRCFLFTPMGWGWRCALSSSPSTGEVYSSRTVYQHTME